ncbi:MAG: hypothetical protein RXO43_00315 [Candidatus Micrarchaeota archaeon]
MESQQYVNIRRIFHLEKELLHYQKKEQKDALASAKRSESQDKENMNMLKNFSSLFRKLRKDGSAKRGKEEVIEELLTYFKALEESRNEYLIIKYLNRLNENRLKKLYGIELNKYNLKPDIETYPIVSDSNTSFSINSISTKFYMPTKENLMGASKLISDIIVVLEQLKGNEPNKNKIN